MRPITRDMPAAYGQLKRFAELVQEGQGNE
jgi:hypothetical protein